MATTGAKLGTSTSAISGTWTNANNILSSSDSNAVASIAIAAKNTTRILEVRSFGFDAAIPADAVSIDSVVIDVRWRVSGTGGIANLDVRGRVSTTDLTLHTNSAEPTSLTINTYDITAERAWVRNDLLDGTFVVRVQARSGNNATSVTYEYDYVTVTVGYTPAASGPSIPVVMHHRKMLV